MWCISEIDEEYKERMFDILDVYERDYDSKNPVICIDEKSKQLLSTPREGKPTRPGKAKKIDYEYKRHGTVNLFVSIEPKGKKRNITVTKRRTKVDFAKEIESLLNRYNEAKKIILVLDNLNTHFPKSIEENFRKEKAERILEKIEWHYTPKHASWLNMAEIEINAISTQLLGKDIASFHEMQKHVFSWVNDRNKKQIGIKWQFTKEKAIDKFKL